MQYIDEEYNNQKIYLQENLEAGYITYEEYEQQLQQIESESQQYYESWAEI